MANTKLTDLTATTDPVSGDKIYLVDISDTSDSSAGSSRLATLSNLSKGVVVTNLDVTGLTVSELLRVNSGGTAIESAGVTLSGSDATVITGTAGTDGDFAQWNADGDLVDGPTPSGADDSVITGTAGTASDLAIWNGDGDLVDGPTPPSGTILGTTDTQTLTNKRITKRITTIVSNATPTVNTDNCDVVTITALATAITSMTTNLSGTPTNFQPLIYRILDNGTGRAITWGASFQAMGVALPTTTTSSKVLTVGFLYDTVDSKWGCVASVEEA